MQALCSLRKTGKTGSSTGAVRCPLGGQRSPVQTITVAKAIIAAAAAPKSSSGALPFNDPVAASCGAVPKCGRQVAPQLVEAPCAASPQCHNRLHASLHCPAPGPFCCCPVSGVAATLCRRRRGRAASTN